MRVVLDGSIFEIEGGVTRAPMVEWPDNIRLDGQQKRKDRRYLSSWAFDNWSGGLGIERQNVDIASQQYRIWDAENVDTRYPNQLVLSPAYNVCTINPSRGDLDHVLQYLGDLYLVESNRVGAFAQNNTKAGAGGIAYRFSAPNTFGSFRWLGNVGDNNWGVGTTSIGSLTAVYAAGAVIAAVVSEAYITAGTTYIVNTLLAIPTLGGSVAVPSSAYLEGLLGTTNYPDNVLLYNRIGRMADVGGTLAILEHTTSNRVKFILADRNYLNPSERLNRLTTIGTYLAPLVSDGVKVYAALPEGIYNFDASPDIEITSSRSQDKNLAQVLFNNELYFKNKRSLMHYDGSVINSVGYDQEDGLPSDKMGEITAMTSSWQHIYAAVYGATYSHILTKDRSGAWQYYARMPSMGVYAKEMWLSDTPDGIDRLWVLPNSGYPGYFLNPMVNPLSAGTYSYVPSGHVTTPWINGGISEHPAVFVDLFSRVDSVQLNPTVNEVEFRYAVDGSPIATYAFQILNYRDQYIFGSLSIDLPIRTHPWGITGYEFQAVYVLGNNNSTGTTPRFRSTVLNYLKTPSIRENYEFNVNLQQTARKFGLPVESIIGTLNAIRDKVSLVPFHYGLVATTAVKVLDMSSSEDIENDNWMGGERKGLMKITLAELI